MGNQPSFRHHQLLSLSRDTMRVSSIDFSSIFREWKHWSWWNFNWLLAFYLLMIFACRLHNMPSTADMQIRYSPIKFLASRLCFYPDKLNKMEGYLFISFKLPSTFLPLNSYGNSQYSFAFSNPVQISVWRFLWSTLLSLTRILRIWQNEKRNFYLGNLEISLYFLLQLFHSDTYQREEKTAKFSARERGGKMKNLLRWNFASFCKRECETEMMITMENLV